MRGFRLAQDGSHTIAVRATGWKTGRFAISIAQPAYDRAPIQFSDITRGEIAFPGKGQAYNFQGDKDDRITVVLDHDLSQGYMRLYAPDGEELAKRNGFPSTDLVIRGFSLPSSGQYTICIIATGAALGKYSLALSKA